MPCLRSVRQTPNPEEVLLVAKFQVLNGWRCSNLYHACSVLFTNSFATFMHNIWNSSWGKFAPKSIYFFHSTVSESDGGNRTRNIAVFNWRFSTLRYYRHPLSYNRVTVVWSNIVAVISQLYIQIHMECTLRCWLVFQILEISTVPGLFLGTLGLEKICLFSLLVWILLFLTWKCWKLQ